MAINKFEKVKNLYDRQLWNIKRVYEAVVHNWITKQEFEQITNISFEQYQNII